MPTVSTLLVVLGVLFFFSAFFSASETALIALNKVRLRHMVESKRRGARRIYGFVSRMDKLIATILVGNNLVNTAIASVATIVCAQYLGSNPTTLLISTVFITIFLVIFGDLVPKTLATSHPEGVAFLVRHLVSFFIMIFTPVTAILTWISNGFIRLFGGNLHRRSPLVTEEEIKMMIHIGKEEGFYGDNERKMLERIFHFDDTEVRDVMTPLEKMVSVPVDVEPDELERVLLEEGHNRVPVYRATRENVVGIIYVHDLIYLYKNSSLIRVEDLMSVPYYIPQNKKVADLLKDFQSKKIQIAIVTDAIGHTVGLVTLEDLIEEIVGEIEEIEPQAGKTSS